MLSLVVEVVEKLRPVRVGKYSRSRSGVTVTMPFSSSGKITEVTSPAGRPAGSDRRAQAPAPTATARASSSTHFSPLRHR